MGAKQELKQETPSVVMPYVEKPLFPSKRFKKICVFCGSSSGKKGVFSNEALNLGRELVGWDCGFLVSYNFLCHVCGLF